MENEVREPALIGVNPIVPKFIDHANGSLNLDKNAERNKEVSERCREVKLQLNRARQIL